MRNCDVATSPRRELFFGTRLEGDLLHLEDFNILAANFGQSGRVFTQGDFNYDGRVNLEDFNILAGRFGNVIAGAASSRDRASDGDEEDSGSLSDRLV